MFFAKNIYHIEANVFALKEIVDSNKKFCLEYVNNFYQIVSFLHVALFHKPPTYEYSYIKLLFFIYNGYLITTTQY